MADLPGFEPRITESKSVVLPLHYRSFESAFAVGQRRAQELAGWRGRVNRKNHLLGIFLIGEEGWWGKRMLEGNGFL